MDPATIIAGMQVVGGLLGGMGASKARRRAEEARRKTLTDYLASADASLSALRGSNRADLWGATGAGQDAIRSLAARTGANAAAGGVFNSSATAGAIAQAQDAAAARVAALAQSQAEEEARMAAENRRWALGQQLGMATDALDQARQNEAGNQQALLGGIMGLAQAFAPAPKAPTVPTTAQVSRAPSPAMGGNPTQSAVQGYQQAFRQALGYPDGRSYGPAVNGSQGAKLPALRLATPGSRLRLTW